MKILFEKEQIENRIKEIAIQILNRHKSENSQIVLVCVLNGGFMFYAKLVEKLAILYPECAFIRVKSYKGQRQTDINTLMDIDIDLSGKHVYVIDDIYDTGVTMNYIRDNFLNKDAASVQLVTLIKRFINEINPPLGFIYGFEIKDEWLVGFGMDDDDGTRRNLPYILAV
jgi:hypoxanthine phosphoribosyltransferase